jgi:hypothetical protein
VFTSQYLSSEACHLIPRNARARVVPISFIKEWQSSDMHRVWKLDYKTDSSGEWALLGLSQPGLGDRG